MQEDKELLERCKRAVDARLSGRRLAHVHSVSDYAVVMARAYGVNEFDARLAGLLHDWDKLLVDEEFPARLKELDIPEPDHVELLWPVLHSFTGAVAVKREFPQISDEVVSAIWHHTIGGLDMSDLDMVIFIADMIEPTRNAQNRPYLQELRDMVGKVSLDELYFATYVETMTSLVVRKRFIHPDAFAIWNGLVAKHNPHPGQKGQGNPNAVL